MREGNMALFTCATTEGTLVIGKDDDSHIYLEVFDVPPEPSRASIRNSAVLGIAAALLETAGYGREAAALPKAALDEMTRTASEDGTADEVDEFVNTRPTFSEGDRVYHVEYPEDGPGTITETAMYGWDWRVVWDNHDVPDSWCKNDELRVYVRRDVESQSYAWEEDDDD